MPARIEAAPGLTPARSRADSKAGVARTTASAARAPVEVSATNPEPVARIARTDVFNRTPEVPMALSRVSTNRDSPPHTVANTAARSTTRPGRAIPAREA